MTHTWVEEKDFHELDLPITIKVCVSPGFDNGALYEVGYYDTYYYFLGSSMYNDSTYGWAGHTNTSEVFGNGTARDVLEAVRYHSAEDVIDTAYVWTSKHESISIPIEDFQLESVNYPHNCYSLDFFNITQQHEVKELGLGFNFYEGMTVEVLLRDTNMNCNRELKDHSFYSTGDSIKLTESQVSMAYMVEISKTLFVKEDPSKRCTDYPTEKFETYKECDNLYMRGLLDKISPELVPIWLTEDINDVSSSLFDAQGDFGMDVKNFYNSYKNQT